MAKKPKPVKAVESDVKKAPSKRAKAKRVSKKTHPAPSLDEVFSALDVHKNGRLGREDIRRAALELGVDLGDTELANMISFWDGSGTNTVSKHDFTSLCTEAGFK